MNSTFNRILSAVCRWTARILGALLVFFTVVIAVGEGMPNPFTQPYKIELGFVSLALILVGILAGWKWEIAGALVSLGGWLAFVSAVAHSPRGLTWFVGCLAMPGVLFLASALMRRHAGKNARTS